MDHDFMIACEEFRYEVQEPLRPTSGYRCEVYNATLPDASPHSWHLKGKALDIKWGKNRLKMLAIAMRLFDGIGIGKTYLHVDKGGSKKLWVY